MLKSVTFRSTLAAVAWAISFSVFAMANGPTQVDIPAGNLVPALEALEKQAAIELVFQPEQLKSFRTKGVKGTYELKDAVRLLLKGTPLELRTDPSGAMVIVPSRAAGNRAQTQSQTSGDTGQAADSRSGLQLAQANVGQTSGTASVAGQTSNSQENSAPGALQEVVVTAQKRAERLQDVPISVAVVSAESMLERQQVTLQDYYATVPGLSINDYGTGRVSITMRGLSTGDGGNPTVGITIDDVPIGATDTAIINGAQFVPQLDPADLQRIEFLKGPQGTLYGATSLAGQMRYITAVPDLAATTAHVEADGSGITSGGFGYGARVGLNVPLISDTLAVRISAFDRRDPGYIDDSAHGRSNLNSVDSYGGYLSALWQATSAVSIRLSALDQTRKLNGDGTLDTNYLFQTPSGALAQDRLPGTGDNSYNLQLYSAEIKAHGDAVEFASVSGYSTTRANESTDETPNLGSLYQLIYPPGVPGVEGATLLSVFHSSKFTQELRLSSADGARFQWLLGGFYTDENNGFNQQQIWANEIATGAQFGTPLLTADFPTKYVEYAGFLNATYHFTDQLSLQLGGREAHNWQRSSGESTGPLASPSTAERSEDNAFTYLITPQLRISDDIMIYARVASGYQAGGPNGPPPPGQSYPLTFDPSRTINYEIGEKMQAMDRHLSLDVALFYVDWSKVQLLGTLPVTFANYIFNGGKAKSEGLEASLSFRPLEGLNINATATYTNAQLTTNAGNGFPGVSGDPLPFSSKFSGAISAEERFSMTSAVEGFVNGTVAYVGRRWEAWTATSGQEPQVPGYYYLNVQGGIKADGFTVAAFVKNLTDQRGILSATQFTGSTLDSGMWRTSIITPRTVGLSISKSF